MELDRSQAQLQALKARYRDSQTQLTEMIVRSGEAIAPEWLLEVPQGPPDDLKRIRGISTKLETLLNGVGITRFKQLAKLDAPGAAWLSTKMGTFPGRIFRDQWVEQAAELSGR